MSTEADLDAVVKGRDWYHTIKLAPGIVTRGWFDCRGIADSVLPVSCEGMRCLDIGTFDGFWAFEMERRGASEVVAIDILDDARWDWPAIPSQASKDGIAERKGQGDGFLIAHERLGSAVERLDASVYELDPAEHGRFDLIYMGSLLLHLRDPVLALERVRTVCSGLLAIADAISLPLQIFVHTPVASLDGVGRPYWWKPNARGLGRMVESAGFEIVTGPNTFFMPAGAGMPNVPIRPSTVKLREGRELIFRGRVGDPHARLTARPVAGA